MTTTNKESIKNATALLDIIEQRKELEKKEKELKDYFKLLTPEGIIEAGKIVVMIKLKSRTGLDRSALVKELGDKIHDFEVTTEYKEVTVMAK